MPLPDPALLESAMDLDSAAANFEVEKKTLGKLCILGFARASTQQPGHLWTIRGIRYRRETAPDAFSGSSSSLVERIYSTETRSRAFITDSTDEKR